MRVIGIDPGLSGAIACYDGSDLIVLDVPSLKSSGRGKELAGAELVDQFNVLIGHANHAYIERVGARPSEGGSSSFKFGYVCGELRMLMVASGIPVTMVNPQVWKNGVGIANSTDKGASVGRAMALFPNMVSAFKGPRGGYKDGAAEAALIAYYGYHKLNGVSS